MNTSKVNKTISNLLSPLSSSNFRELYVHVLASERNLGLNDISKNIHAYTVALLEGLSLSTCEIGDVSCMRSVLDRDLCVEEGIRMAVLGQVIKALLISDDKSSNKLGVAALQFLEKKDYSLYKQALSLLHVCNSRFLYFNPTSLSYSYDYS